MTTLRQAAVAALEALEITSSEYCQGCWLEVIAALKEALAQLDKKCEAGVSLQGLWDCWDAVHGVGQEPVAWIRESDLKLLNGDLDCCLVSATRDFTDRVPLYLHPAPIPEGWVMVPKEPTAAMDFAGAKAADEMFSANISKLMGPLGGHVVRDDYDDITLAYVNDEISSVMGIYKAMLVAAPKYEEQSK